MRTLFGQAKESKALRAGKRLGKVFEGSTEAGSVRVLNSFFLLRFMDCRKLAEIAAEEEKTSKDYAQLSKILVAQAQLVQENVITNFG